MPRGKATCTVAGLLFLFTASVASALEHRVQRGDTLSELARRYGVSVRAIQGANGLTSTTILVGQVLTIPGASRDRVHVVRSGDTLSALAIRYRTTTHAIRVANGISGSLIRVGQRLVIPGAGPISGPLPGGAPRGGAATVAASSGSSGASRVVHLVRRGDTLSELAASYGTTVGAIRAANGLRSTLIRTGERLAIPSTRRAAAPTAGGQPLLHAPMAATAAEVEILARIVKGECPPHVPWEGKVAVAAVVLNRVRSRSYPSTIRRAAHQPYQFSCYNRNVRSRLYWGRIPNDAWRAARAALAGADPSYGSTHYFNPYLVRPSWARQLRFVRRIGRGRSDTHDFYRPRHVPAPRPRSSGLAEHLR